MSLGSNARARAGRHRHVIPRDRRGVTTGDVLIGLALASLVGALLYPTLRAGLFRRAVDAAAADVESLRVAAVDLRQRTGSWPPASRAGVIPREISNAFPDDTALVRSAYTLEWGLLEVVEQVPAPSAVLEVPADADATPDSVGPTLMPVVRSLGRIEVHSGNSSLLAELFDRYGPDSSFVRDSSWTLVVRIPSGG